MGILQKNYLVFDIGGTQTRFAVFDGARLGAEEVIATPKKFTDGLRAFERYADSNFPKGRLGGAVGGIRGRLDRNKTRTFDRIHIPDWAGKPFVPRLKEKLGVPVYLENDAALTGLGEAVYGAGKGRRIVVYMTVSSGVGGTRIVNGHLDDNIMGFEPGKQIIDCDKLKSLEDYVSGAGLRKRYGKPASEIDDKKIWDDAARVLAVGIYNSILHWSPEVVVLGGGVMKSLRIDAIRKNLKALTRNKFEPPILRKAMLGDLGGLHGAVAVINQKFKIKNKK